MISKDIQKVSQVIRTRIPRYIYNRNPRNLEKLCIAYKPDGWHLENPGRCYWHKLCIERSAKNLSAYIKHYSGKIPLQVSTKEWAIRKHLYSTTDKSAYLNLARIFAYRCMQFGITEMYSEHQPTENKDFSDGTNIQIFINELHKSGISLKEPDRYINPRPSDLYRPDKPWKYY